MILSHRSSGRRDDPVALLVHGAGTSAGYWDRAAAWFGTRGWCAISVDLRGHGQSRVVLDGSAPTLGGLADDLVETMGELRPSEQPPVDVLIGSSLGAAVALTCLADHDAFARRLILEEPPGIETLDLRELTRAGRELAASARRDPEAFARDYFRDADVQPSESFLSEFGKALAAVDYELLEDVMEDLAEADVEALLGRCPVPTLLLLGRDRGSPIGSGSATPHEDLASFSAVAGRERDRYANALRAGTVVELDGGHDLHQQAFPAWTESVAAWLEPPIDSADDIQLS
jgi:pimeloyl-ACP methyl ester carboxylesterase